MDKYEYKIRSDEIKSLIAKGDYAQAAEIADTIDWRRVKSVMMLCTISDLYKINRRYEDAKNMLLLAYERRPGGRTICYSLCELCIKTEDLVQALKYYKEFVQVAPRDTGRYILQYKIYEAQEVSIEERIGVLEELKRRDYREKWAYELAYLYHRMGLATRCVEECDELILWFGDGKYVVKAMELKMLHQPLTPAQQDIYDRRFEEAPQEGGQEAEEFYEDESVYGQQPDADQEGYGWAPEDGQYTEDGSPDMYGESYGDMDGMAAADMDGESSADMDDIDIHVKTMDVGQYNTMNLQAELAAGLQEVLGAEGMADAGRESPGQPEVESAWGQEGYEEFASEEMEESEVFFGATGEIEDMAWDAGTPGEEAAMDSETVPGGGMAEAGPIGPGQEEAALAGLEPEREGRNQLWQTAWQQPDGTDFAEGQAAAAQNVGQMSAAAETAGQRKEPRRDVIDFAERQMAAERQQAVRQAGAVGEVVRQQAVQRAGAAGEAVRQQTVQQTGAAGATAQLSPTWQPGAAQSGTAERRGRQAGAAGAAAQQSSAWQPGAEEAAGQLPVQQPSAVEEAVGQPVAPQPEAAGTVHGQQPDGAGPSARKERQEDLPVDETARQVMEEMRSESVEGGQVPRELEEVLSQEANGQISLVLPESAAIEKQITGQMKIDDILMEWERMKKENEEKRKEEVRMHILHQTGPMFTEFEAAIRDGLLEQLEKGAADKEDRAEARQAMGEEGKKPAQSMAGEEAAGATAGNPVEDSLEYIDRDVRHVTENGNSAQMPEESGAGLGDSAEYPAAPGAEDSPEYLEGQDFSGKGMYGKADLQKAVSNGEHTRSMEAQEEIGAGKEVGYEKGSGYEAGFGDEENPGFGNQLEDTGGTENEDDYDFWKEEGYEDETGDGIGRGFGAGADYIEESAARKAVDEEDLGYLEGLDSEEAAYYGQPEERVTADSVDEETYYGDLADEEEAAYADTADEEEAAYADLADEEEAAYADLADEEEAAYADTADEEEAVYGDMADEEDDYNIVVEQAAYGDIADEEDEAGYTDMAEETARDLQDEEGMQEADIIEEIEGRQKQAIKADKRPKPAKLKRQKEKAEKPSETEEEQPIERDQEKIRSLSREERELFASFIQSRRSKEQLIKAIDSLSMAAYTGNLIVTGEEGIDMLTLAKNIVRDVQVTDRNFSGKVAKITGQGLNDRNVEETLERLNNGALIIEAASGMSPETAARLHRSLQQERLGIIVIMEDTKKAMKKLLLGTPDLYGDFSARIDLEALSNDTLVSFGRQYAREMEYSIDDLGILALHTRIEELQTIDHVVTVAEVKQIVDEAFHHASRKTLGHFFDVLLARRYDDEDMIILTEKDFVA